MNKTLLCLLVLVLGAWANSYTPNTSATFPKVVKKIALTNHTSTIAQTALLQPATSGLYRVTVYMVQPTPTDASCGNACGNLTASFQWTDDGGNQVMGTPGVGVNISSPFGLSLVSTCAPYPTGACQPSMAALLPASFVARVNAGTPLSYSITGEVGSGVSYDFFLTLEQLE